MLLWAEVWGVDFVTAFGSVCYLTIEDEKKEKRGRRSLRGSKEFGLQERDFDGHVLDKRTPCFCAAMHGDGSEFSSIQ